MSDKKTDNILIKKMYYKGNVIMSGGKLGYEFIELDENKNKIRNLLSDSKIGGIIGALYEIPFETKNGELTGSYYPSSIKYVNETLQDDDLVIEWRVKSKENSEEHSQRKLIKSLETKSKNLEDLTLKQIKENMKGGFYPKKSLICWIMNYLL